MHSGTLLCTQNIYVILGKSIVDSEKYRNFAHEKCEYGLHLGNSNMFDCSRFAPSLRQELEKEIQQWH